MLSLKGKKIMITGVSREKGIGKGIAERLAAAGAEIFIHGYSPYDIAQEYQDGDNEFQQLFIKQIRQSGGKAELLPPIDLQEEAAPVRLFAYIREMGTSINGLVLNHAYSTCTPLGAWTAKDIDAHMNINIRASMLLIQEFASQLPSGERGAITLFTSGQYLGPMIKEIPYAVSKDGIIGLGRQTAMALAPQGIQVNCVNPGPTDTGYLFGDDYEQVARMFPAGKWLMPEDAARLVHFLQSDDSRSITGQVIGSEAGFRRDVIL